MFRRCIGILLLCFVGLCGLSACRGEQASSLPAEDATIISQSQAETLALQALAFSVDEVSAVYTAYAFDNGMPHYTITIQHNDTTYIVTVHAENGKVLSVTETERTTR